MIPREKDLILQDRVKLYNNLAKINDCEGRLLAELEIYPTPRLTWDFEVLGELKHGFPHGSLGESNSIMGHSFSMKNAKCTGDHSGMGPSRALSGYSKQAVYGELGSLANLFIFYLPNTQFQVKGACQNPISQILRDASNDKEIASCEGGRYISASIDESWDFRLDIRKEALEWLKPKNKNIGTLLTTAGTLSQPKFNESGCQDYFDLEMVTLHDALERIQNLCRLLSYVNGGYLGPLYIEGYQLSPDTDNMVQISSSVALPFQTTPLEKLGESWLTEFSNLNEFVGCFSVFERMMNSPLWQETFDFTLIQYFQAIQHDQSWQVRASALGAALERLSYMILVVEEKDSEKKSEHEMLFEHKTPRGYAQLWNNGENNGKYVKRKDESGKNIYLSSTGIRLSCLLERIGLLQDIEANSIQDFLDVRNDAVHPRQSAMNIDRRLQLIRKALQWIDEVLLWRIGYKGQYLDRTQEWTTPIPQRYNLELRDSSW